MQVSVNIEPEIVEWVVNNIHVDKITNSMMTEILQWRLGAKKPTFNQIEAVSRATNIPLGYFFLKTPPKEDNSLLEYRTIDSVELQKPSRNLIDTIHDMEKVQEWMKDYLVASQTRTFDIVGICDKNKDPFEIANLMRKTLGLGTDWFVHSKNAWESFKRIRELAESIGIIVMLNGVVGNNTHRKLDINEFRAFTLIDKNAPLIFINSNDSQNAKLFSLMHEMAHIWIGIQDLYNDRLNTKSDVNESEILCNAVSGELLVPQAIFTKKWAEQTDSIDNKKRISSLASYFSCGTTVIARKALINRYIESNVYNEIAKEAVQFYSDLQIKKPGEESGGDYYNTMATRLDKRFLSALANSAGEGKTLFTDAFRLTHTNRKTFLTLIEKMRGDQE